MNSKQQVWEAENDFSKKLHHEYTTATSSFLDNFSQHHKYMITITHTQPSRCIRPSELLVDISDFYQSIQDIIFTQRHKGQIPERLRPALVFFLDIDGSRGNGRAAFFELEEAKNRAIRGLHAHGILLLNPDTYKQFVPELNIRCGAYIVHFQPFDAQKFSANPGYISKMIAAAKLTNIDFCQGYLYHSKTRESITPEELEEFSVTPQAANTNEIQCVHLESQPQQLVSSEAHSKFHK